MRIDRSSLARPAAVLCGVALLVSADIALAQSNWAVALRDAAAIQKFVGTLLPHGPKAPGAGDAAAVVLYKQNFFDVEESSHQECVNLVVLVNDPAALGDFVTAPYLATNAEPSIMAAFQMRGDTLTLLEDEQIEFQPGDDDILRDRCSFDFGELEKGDVIGWSIVLDREGPLFIEQIPMTSRYPVVYSSLRVKTSGQNTYEISGRGVTAKDFKVVTGDAVEGYPSTWKVSMKNLEAIEDLPLGGPFIEDVPLYEIAMRDIWVEIPNMTEGWVPVLGWNQNAMILAGLGQRSTEDLGGLDITASALTTGKASAMEKEVAVYEYVRDNISLLQGDRYERGGMRKPKEVLTAKEGTEAEKVMLMMALLESVGVSSDFAAVRPAGLGDADERIKSMVQFRTLILRCGNDVPRFYAPQCASCGVGELPAPWGDATVLSPVRGLLETSQEVLEQARIDAFTAGEIDLRKMADFREEQDWHHMEKASYAVME